MRKNCWVDLRGQGELWTLVTVIISQDSVLATVQSAVGQSMYINRLCCLLTALEILTSCLPSQDSVCAILTIVEAAFAGSLASPLSPWTSRKSLLIKKKRERESHVENKPRFKSWCLDESVLVLFFFFPAFIQGTLQHSRDWFLVLAGVFAERVVLWVFVCFKGNELLIFSILSRGPCWVEWIQAVYLNSEIKTICLSGTESC